MFPKKKIMNERGVITYAIVFIFLAFILLTVFVFITPVLIEFNAEMYAAGEEILLDANATANEFQNQDIKAQFQDALGSAQQSIPTQVSILAAFFQYAWIIILIVVLMVLYMLTRETVEAEIT